MIRLAKFCRIAARYAASTVPLLPLLVAACSGSSPILLGYVGGLTGRVADLGVNGRDGVQLAVELLNAKGGIHGRPVTLLVRDDRQDAEVAARVNQELIDAGVVAIVGHMTSAMSVSSAPIINNRKVVMVSPTTSTNILSGQDDYFFRVYPPSAKAAAQLARFSAQTKGLSRIAAIYDIENRAYTEDYFQHFRTAFERAGGEVSWIRTFRSGEADMAEIAAELLAENVDGLFLNAGSLDTALLCQQLERLDSKLPIVTTEWAMTNDLIRLGGSAVVGTVFSHTFDRYNSSEIYTTFRQAFAKRFGYEPGFAAAHAYEAATVVFTALLRNSDPSKLKQTIVNIGKFAGLQGSIEFDRFGDPGREHLFTTIQDGRFVRLETK